jgi:acyl-CoA dehydrogenase
MSHAPKDPAVNLLDAPSPASADPAAAAARIESVRRIARDVAGPAATAVDRDARFPSEAIEALKVERLLSAHVPVALGGFGSTIAELGQMCEALGQRCASTAMVFAMHQVQVACVVRHGRTPFFEDYLADLASGQRLVASVTSEAGIGGSVRTSICPN